MKRPDLILFVLLILMSPSCKTKDKLTGTTLVMSINPSSKSMSAGASQTFSVSGFNAGKDVTSMLDVDWDINPANGSLNKATGPSVTFTAGSNTGSVTLTATDGSVSATSSISITATGGAPSDDFVIYDDSFNAALDAPGAFNGGGDSIVLSADTTIKSEGSQSFKSSYTVTGAGWAGWYVSASSVRDMSAYASGHVKFDIRTSKDIQIGIRSDNIGSGSNTAKKYLSDYAVTLNNTFQAVSIPIADLVAAQAGTDLSQMKDMFIATAVGAQIGAAVSDFYIDNIRWTED